MLKIIRRFCKAFTRHKKSLISKNVNPKKILPLLATYAVWARFRKIALEEGPLGSSNSGVFLGFILIIVQVYMISHS